MLVARAETMKFETSASGLKAVESMKVMLCRLILFRAFHVFCCCITVGNGGFRLQGPGGQPSVK